MTDTRIEDMRRAFTKHAREAHPEWSHHQITVAVDREIAAAIASPQSGTQVWMNRPAGLTVEEFEEFSAALDELFTLEEKAAMSSTVSYSLTNPDQYEKYHRFLCEWRKDHP